MTDENKNIENNQEENQNKPEGNKKWWTKSLNLKQNYTRKLVLLIFIVSIFTFGCKIQTNAISNVEQNKKKSEIIEHTNIEEMKISTPEECKEKGLHYIGKMNVPRIFHKTIKLKDGNILIIGGNNKLKVENTKPHLKGPFANHYNYEYIKNKTAEIFNPTNNSFTGLFSMPSQSNYFNIITLKDGNILLCSKKLEIYDIKEQNFRIINKKNLNDKITSFNPRFCEKIGNEYLLECNHSNKNELIKNKCVVTNLTDYSVKYYKEIDFKFPEKPLILGYLKINENELFIYTEIFSPRNKSTKLNGLVYDISKNKILKTAELINFDSCEEVPIATLIEKNKILFAIKPKFGYKLCRPHAPFQWFIYDIDTNKVSKNIDMLYPHSVLVGEPIKYDNSNFLIFEGNKIRQMLDLKTYELKKFDGFEIKNLENMNIIQINHNQLLITGGIQKTNNTINDMAWIYTF